MRQAISDVLPYAVGVAVSPIPLIGVILILFSPHAKRNGPAFLAGWVVGLSVVVTVVYAIAHAAKTSTDQSASDSSSTVQVVLGVVLLVLAARKWRNRPAPGEPETMPKWMSAVDSFSAAKAAGFAVVLSVVNPKNLILAVGASAEVAQGGYSTADAVVALAVFVALASLSTAILVGYSLVEGEKAERTLDGWKTWLAENNVAVMSVLFLVFGVVLVGKGLGRIS